MGIRTCADCKFFHTQLHLDEDNESELDNNCNYPLSDYYEKEVMAEESCEYYQYKGVFTQGTRLIWINGSKLPVRA